MSRRSIITIAVGVLVIAALYLISNQVTSARVKTLQTETDTWKKVEGYQLLESIRATFLAGEVVVLLVTAALAIHWRKSGVALPSGPGMPGEGRITPVRMPFYFAAFPGILAVVTSFTSELLDVFVFNVYGGVSPNTLLCLGLPPGVLGMLAGFVWYRIRRKSGISRFDAVPLIVIGLLSGYIPGVCIKMLPQ